jgi:transcriptional regulator with XRE-family HTH domain
MVRKIKPEMRGTEVRRIRKALGFTQEEFSRFLWVTYSTLNRWEADRAKPFGMHLQILLLLRRELTKQTFRDLLHDPRSADPTFLLFGLLKSCYGNHRLR